MVGTWESMDGDMMVHKNNVMPPYPKKGPEEFCPHSMPKKYRCEECVIADLEAKLKDARETLETAIAIFEKTTDAEDFSVSTEMSRVLTNYLARIKAKEVAP